MKTEKEQRTRNFPTELATKRAKTNADDGGLLFHRNKRIDGGDLK
jgi:hypothetical protein